MPYGDAARIRQYLRQLIGEAREAGKQKVTLRAGDIHSALNLSHAHRNVCQVLEGQKFHAMAGVQIAEYVYSPPSGQGANLTIEFDIHPETH